MDNKFNLGDPVFYKNNIWYVSGVVADVGYGLKLWRYYLTKGTYYEGGPSSWGARNDVDNECLIPEDSISTPQEAGEKRLKELIKEEEELRTKLTLLAKKIEECTSSN